MTVTKIFFCDWGNKGISSRACSTLWLTEILRSELFSLEQYKVCVLRIALHKTNPPLALPLIANKPKRFLKTETVQCISCCLWGTKSQCNKITAIKKSFACYAWRPSRGWFQGAVRRDIRYDSRIEMYSCFIHSTQVNFSMEFVSV